MSSIRRTAPSDSAGPPIAPEVLALAQALAAVLRPPVAPETAILSMKDAASTVGLSYHAFRKVEEFRLANVAPQDSHPRFDRGKLLRIAENLRSTH